VSEYGGTYGSKTPRFVPPNRLRVARQRFRFSLDPAADLRGAISAGRAHDEGKTQLDGRTVERIRIANLALTDIRAQHPDATGP
jgi:hypothetical protein